MITELTLTNLKCFAQQSVPLGALTLLTGINGTGKSTVIQSLLLLRQSWLREILTKGALALNGELVEMGTGRDALYEGATKDEIGIGLKWDAGKVEWFFAVRPELDVLTMESDPIPEQAYQKSPFGDGFQYLTAERIGPRVAFPTSTHAVREQRQLGRSGEYATHYLAIFGTEKVQLPALIRDDAASSSLLNQVESWLSVVSPGTQLQIQEFANLNLAELRYAFSGGDVASRSYRSMNVGFGLTYSLPILVAVLGARPGALLVIENPEAHLHPRGQEALGEFLVRAAKDGVQLVVETHSDHVLNGVRLAVAKKLIKPELVRTHFFHRRTGEGARGMVSPQIDADGRLSDWPRDFFDQWDRSLEELLNINEAAR
jgi:predicted ATPase